MGFIVTVRRLLGIGGPDDGGVASAIRGAGQIPMYGATRPAGPFDSPPADPVELSGDLPWELGGDDRPAAS